MLFVYLLRSSLAQKGVAITGNREQLESQPAVVDYGVCRLPAQTVQPVHFDEIATSAVTAVQFNRCANTETEPESLH